MKKLIAIIFAISLIAPSPAQAYEGEFAMFDGVCIHHGALSSLKSSYGLSGLTSVLDDGEFKKSLSYAYPVAGESYRADNSMTLLKKYGSMIDISDFPNVVYDGKHKIFLTKATLIPEPSNKFDKFAVKVIIKGKHVGYVPGSVSYDVSYMMKKSKKKTINVNACVSHYPGGQGPQVTLDLNNKFLGEDFESQYRMGIWFIHNDHYESGPGTKCTKYFSKWYCGPLEK